MCNTVGGQRRLLTPVDRCRANMAHIRQSRQDYGLNFQVNFRDLVLLPLRSEAESEYTPVHTREARGARGV